MHITKSTEKQTLIELKKSLINGLSKRLLELEFKLNHSIKSKCWKWIVKKNNAHNIRDEKHAIKNKTKKGWGKKWSKFMMQRLHW